ncbi:hypothetical protein [Methylomonas methanica]|uniref:Uncharacterized protein n=1 Tax=Methylomonas methanica (strain DSM 25384 / MC09) TaxID=857087 RepID=F9ZVD0_METMM|nr:hypothetical protein [Methylomonas methanica]AEG00740.1 hypothetical protein Metme_2339 [Methylomonas methanica MC09]
MKRSDLAKSSHAQAISMESQAARLFRSLSNAWQKIAFSSSNITPEEQRLFAIKERAYFRYLRRKEITNFVYEQILMNSGDSERLPAGAPVVVDLDTLQVSDPTQRHESAGQGGNQECQADYFFVNDFCQCDACRPRHDHLVGVYFARAWQAGTL